MGIDEAYLTAQRILGEADANLENIRSEEDAKLQIITRILTEVLGWNHSDISSESPNQNGFSDYLVSDGAYNALVVEAKKIGIIGIKAQSKTMGTYRMTGPVLGSAMEGIKQAASYCHPLGVQLAVLTDGCAWIVFVPWVPQASYLDRQAVVFPGFDAILSDFSNFYELLSRSEVTKRTFRIIFDRLHENRLVLDRPLSAPFASSENQLLQKSALAFDLENVFASFFAGLTGDNDPEMLIECFVETRESRIADFSLERIAKNVLGNIGPTEKAVEESLQSIVQDTVAGDVGQTVFIVGPSGAGKSTFLSRFFARTLSAAVRERCVVISIDALDASGNETLAIPWMTERAISSIEAQLFAEGFPEWNDLQALYHLEYLRRSRGVDALLYNRNKEEFREKFAAYVERQVEEDREGYLNRLLKDIVRNRKKLPIFVVDNTDEFSLTFRVAIFQYFQALRRSSEHCLLFFPATDRSAWAFSKTEIFNIYTSRSFFLPTPSPREVFRRRVDYLKAKVELPATDKKKVEYFFGRGIRVTIADLAAFASVVEKIFVDQDYAAKRVGELSNYNMRKALGLSKRVITSAVLGVDDLIRSYITGDLVAPSPDRFMNALMRGDYEFFRAVDEPLLFPMFQVDAAIRQSPLIHARILTLLRDMHQAASEDVDRCIEVGSILSYFGVMSVSEIAVQRSLEALLSSDLIEPYDLSKKEYSVDQRVSITHSGLSHLELALFNPVYFAQMALTTRIIDADLAAQLRGAYSSSKSIDARMEEVREIFCSFLIAEDARESSVPETAEFEAQRFLSAGLLRQWKTAKTSADQMMRLSDLAATATLATIEHFDHYRGYGFVEVPELRDSAFLHARILEQGGFEEVHDGDDLICDIVRTEKGLAVSQVLEVRAHKSRAYGAKIVKLFPDRNYGFVHVAEIGADAFFHYNLFSADQQAGLVEGQELTVEVKTDKQGRSQVRRLAATG